MEWSDELRDTIDGIRDEIDMDMSERQVSAHYTFDPLHVQPAEELQEEYDLSQEEANKVAQMAVRSECRQQFEDDHDLTFSTDYVSVEKSNHRWSCTIMTNQT
jgi:hypothetical protein